MSKKKAFYAAPFRKEFDWVRESVWKACEQSKIELRAVDELVAPGEDIPRAIYVEIKKADFAFVVISSHNANVMYELGWLHALSKPTIILSDQDIDEALPFDISHLNVIRYRGASKNKAALTEVVSTAIKRLQDLMIDGAIRQSVVAGPPFHLAGVSHNATAQLTVSDYDFERIKGDAAKSVGCKNCETENISEYKDSEVTGWRIKARCSGGKTIVATVDLNGDIREIDVR